jgi:hypothetical protein
MGKNKKPMLTVLVEEEKLQRFRDYASIQGMSMGSIVNQLIDRLLSGESSPESIETSIDNNESIENFINTSIENNNKTIEAMIAISIDNCHKSIEETISTSIVEHHKSIEEKIATAIEHYDKSIDNYTETSPPTLSLQDIDRLIGSAIASVTKTTTDLENIIKHQGGEIDRLSKMMAPNIESPTTTAIQPLSGDTLTWGEFCEMIDEPLPKERNKASGDKMVVRAESKGFNGWRYDGKTKKFTQPPN